MTEADVVDMTRCHDLLLVRRSIRRVVIGFFVFSYFRVFVIVSIPSPLNSIHEERRGVEVEE